MSIDSFAVVNAVKEYKNQNEGTMYALKWLLSTMERGLNSINIESSGNILKE